MSQKSVPNYTIIRPIGKVSIIQQKGAFAIVYVAQHNQSKEVVAIKQMIDVPQGKMWELFQSEIAVMKRVKHRSILELKDLVMHEGTINMILEYCALGDLEKYIKKNSPKNRLTEEEAKPIISQIVDAIKVLRLNNIVHRDLKLPNILIDENLQVKLADFGFAKLQEDRDIFESYCGTPMTMAPEILKKYPTYDSSCDMWSLGVMIYQMLVGQPPFMPAKGTIPDLITAIQTQKLTFPQHIAISHPLKDLLRRMLVEDPRDRLKFEELFRHPYVQEEQDLFQSVIKPKDASHTHIIQQIGFTLGQQQKYLQTIIEYLIAQTVPQVRQEIQELISELRAAFSSLKLHILYSNKQVTVDYGKFTYFDLSNSLLAFVLKIYEIGIQYPEINLKSLLNVIQFNRHITNNYQLQYEEYTITFPDELKQSLQICCANSQIELTPMHQPHDLRMITQLIEDRYK